MPTCEMTTGITNIYNFLTQGPFRQQSNTTLPCHDILTILDGRGSAHQSFHTMTSYAAIATALSSTAIRVLAYVFFRWVAKIQISFSCLSTS